MVSTDEEGLVGELVDAQWKGARFYFPTVMENVCSSIIGINRCISSTGEKWGRVSQSR